jgi:TonB-linked SusC/RagA family outer membrane protein
MYNFYINKLARPPGCTLKLLLTMRLTTLLLLTAIMQVSAGSFAQKVSLAERQSPLIKVFNHISDQTGYDFLVASNILKNARPVTIKVTNEELGAVLGKIMKEQDLRYSIQERVIVIAAKEQAGSAAVVKQVALLKISGKVTDSTGLALPNAKIIVSNSKDVVYTDKNGAFTIAANAGDEITVSFIGFRSYTFSVSEGMTFRYITLQPAVENIAAIEVVSTGYQTLPKERATGSFAQVDSRLYNRRVGSDVLGRLEGVVPGLIFNRNTTGSSQGMADISIRGNSTLYAGSQPLIVVDGFPFEGDINNLNPNTVESVTVLKDAAAASIWGVRSGNGVIVISTKKGSRNQDMVVDFNANLTVSSKPDLNYNPNFLPSGTFIDLEKQLFDAGYYNADLNSAQHMAVSPVVQLLADQRSGKIGADAVNTELASLKNTDVRNDLSKYFYRRAVSQQYAFSLRGGGTRDDYFFSTGYDQDQSNLRRNGNDRVTVSSRYNFYPAKGLTLSASLNYTHASQENNNPVGDLKTTRYSTIYPYARLADDKGQSLPVIHQYPDSYTDTVGRGKLQDWNYRPLDELRDADNTIKTQDTRLQFGSSYDLLDHFRVSLNYQYQHTTVNGNNYHSPLSYYTRDLVNRYSQIDAGGNVSYPIPVGGILQQNDNSLSAHDLRAQLDYHQVFKKNRELNILAGAEIRETVNRSASNTLYGYDPVTLSNNAILDYVTNYNLLSGSSAQIPTSLGLDKLTNRYISYYANGSYTFNHRYILSASGRVDKSNLFGVNTNQKAAPLYSAGLAWNLSKEPFYKLDWLPYAKLRATYGYNGNVNTSATAQTTIREFDPSFNYYSPIPFDRIINPGNPDLRWERIRMVNFGLDFSTKNDRISGSIEFYLKNGNDLFGYSPIAPSAGMTSFFGNNADIRGHGFDIQLNTENVSGGGLRWKTNLLFSHATDIVSRYGTSMTSTSYIALSNASSVYPLEGKNLYSLYSYKWGGLTANTGDPQGFDNSGKRSTDYAAILSGTGINDMVDNGSSRPLYFGSLRNTFSYKGLSLSANITCKFDYYFRRTSYTSGSMPWSGNQDFFLRWQRPGDELKTDVPALQLPPGNNDRDNFYQLSSALVEKGDHIRLQDISVSYDWSRSAWRKMPFHHLQVYGYVNNVGILWRANHHGLDPDLLVGSYLSSYPLPLTVSIGFKITP